MGSLTTLAEQALVQAKAIDAYLNSQELPSTSFDHDSLSTLPSELNKARESLINATQDLKRLALGPAGVFTEITWACADEVSLGAIYDYQLANHVPLDGTTTFTAISQASGLPEDLVERFLRHAMSNHIFTEEEPGQVQHTASSRLLATDPDMNDTIGMMLRETWQASARTLDAVKRYPGSSEPGDTAFSLINKPGVPMFEYLANHPERARRFGGAMRYYGKFEGWNLKHLVDGYDWASLDRVGAKIVDVGGGQGAVSIALAKATKNIGFVVQDLDGTIQDGRNALPEELKKRVDFQAHDFFTEQPVKYADIYFFRWILHDWSDKYAARILQNLIPAMKEGTRIVVYEWLLADGPETRWTERQARNNDIIMLAQFNARERSAKAFQRLFEIADPRFSLTRIFRPPGSAMSIVEATWKDEG